MAANRTPVLINGMSVVTRDSEGRVVGMPDLCKAPSPGGPMPVPFPNIAQSRDLEGGSSTVFINGAAVCLASSKLGRSTGDEAGSLGGFASGKTMGAAHPVSYSLDVRIQGKPVVRNLDLFTLNDRNTLPFPIVQAQPAPAVARPLEERQEEGAKCPYCGRAGHVGAEGKAGDNIGASGVLRRNILQGRGLERHRWYAGHFTLGAHHLICSEAMKGEDWARYCGLFGYDINRRENGVMLPSRMALACQLHVALHRGNHDEGWAHDLHLPYPNAVKSKLEEVAEALERGAFCDNPEGLTRKLDKLSAEILGKVERFQWTLTSDGLDYQEGGAGCGGVTSIPEKRLREACPNGRWHNLRHPTTRLLLSKRPLRVGE